jgi:peptide/nickel transport system permease protein
MPAVMPTRAKFGMYILAAFFLVALIGPSLSPFNPNDFVDVPHQPPSLTHLFGTTGQGQDVLSQTITGARTSLLVGFTVGFMVTLIGATVGAIAASFGNFVDDLLSLVTNVFLVVPSLPMAVVVAAYLPASTSSLVGVLLLTGWAWNARVVRAHVASLHRKEFVLAAIVSGESRLQLVFRELLPNMMTILSSCFVNATIYAIGAEVGLEFLGLGDLGAITWGTNLYWASNDAALLTGAWWTILPTGLSLALVGTALVLVNSALDDIANPRARSMEPWRRFLAKHSVSPESSTPVVKNHG